MIVRTKGGLPVLAACEKPNPSWFGSLESAIELALELPQAPEERLEVVLPERGGEVFIAVRESAPADELVVCDLETAPEGPFAGPGLPAADAAPTGESEVLMVRMLIPRLAERDDA